MSQDNRDRGLITSLGRGGKREGEERMEPSPAAQSGDLVEESVTDGGWGGEFRSHQKGFVFRLVRDGTHKRLS